MNVTLPNEIVDIFAMNRRDWIFYTWERVTFHPLDTVLDKHVPRYICTGIRPIEQAEEAARQFDIMRQNAPHERLISE